MFDGSQLTARVRVVGKDKQAVEFKNSTALTGKLLNKLLMFKNSTALKGKLLNKLLMFKNSTALTGKLLNKLLMFKNSTALTGKLLNNPTKVRPLFMLSHGGSVQC